MRYSELIDFNPVESVIVLKHADDTQKAKELVQSYVMSDDMADKLDYGLLRHLQLDEVVDNKGVLIVGNYGTGKSHLMSVVSAIAEDEGLLDELRNERFAGYMEPIAGQFEVLRIELGAVENSLRNIIISELEDDLARRQVDYKFPESSTLTNHKGAFEAMMYAFESKYPGRGYLLVVDELLDYLRTRKEEELIADLGFLREVGEFIKTSRFRFTCGVQEQLFENAQFAHVAESLSRVKDRFDQVIIRKEDTNYVVSERILSKTPEQKARIREHLMPFCPLYSEMSERLEDYVDLYPIHPAYIDVFNKVNIAENRHVLETVSTTIYDILDEDVPSNVPGIISFDSYWGFIKDNYARRSEDDIREVLEKSEVLEEKIAKTFPKEVYKDMALQIVYALSVHRLTTGGVRVRIGLTAEELRDDLCLYIEDLPERDSEFLLSIIQVTLKDIMLLMNGQFIEHNKENGQYFLDIDKDIDYDAKIESKVTLLSSGTINRHYYSIVYDLLEWDGHRAVTSYEIYEYSLNWDSHNIFRRGYLFLGLPTERSTAQPPRDYYIYILPPYGDKAYQYQRENDEVFLKLSSSESFTEELRLFAAAMELRKSTSDQHVKKIYLDKARAHERKVKKWLNENKETCYKVIYRGVEQQLIEKTQGMTRECNFKDTIDMAASICLDEYFSELYPNFPVFKTKVTRENNAHIIERAINHFAGQETGDSRAFLESFELIENGRISVENSKYAMKLVRELDKLPKDSVINRMDILETEHKGYDDLYDKTFKINNEYYVIVLLALVHAGYANLVLKDITITASNMDKLAQKKNSDIYEFRYLTKPKDAAIVELKKLLEILELPPGMATNDKELQMGLDKILFKADQMARLTINRKQYINNEPKLWGELLFPENVKSMYESKLQVVLDEFSNFRNRYNTVAKIKNLNLTMDQLGDIEEGMDYIRIIIQYEEFKKEVDTLVNYISNIESLYLPVKLREVIDNAKEEFFTIRDEIRETVDGNKASRELKLILEPIKSDYIEYYYDMHRRARLGMNQAEKKGEIMGSRTYKNLKKLTEIDNIFQVNKLRNLEVMLSELLICYELTVPDLAEHHICRSCNFMPSKEAPAVSGQLEYIEKELEDLLDDWTQILLAALEDPLSDRDLLGKDQQALIESVIKKGALPEVIDTFFTATCNTLFAGLDRVSIDMWDMMDLVQDLGPTTVDEFKKKLGTYIDAHVKGKDLNKVRIIVNMDSDKKKRVVVSENDDEGVGSK